MRAARLPANEQRRLEALYRYGVLDTEPEAAFDELAGLAAQLTRCPIALVALVDAQRQWFKSHLGLDMDQSPRECSFCSYAILDSRLLVVPDARVDKRFAEAPMVVGPPQVRFYAGMPLITPDGYAIGTLCVMDHKPRRLTAQQAGALEILARQVMTQLELRRRLSELASSMEEQRRVAQALSEAELKYRGIFENVVEGIFQTTEDGHYIAVNPMLARIYGYASPEELMTAVQDIRNQLYVQPGRREEFVRTVQEHGVVTNFESQVRRKDGSIIWISENARAVRDEMGRFLYFEGTVEDITQRKEAEEALRRSELLYHSLVENLPQFIFRKDSEGRFTFANQRLCQMLGKPLEEVLGKTDFDFFPHELAAKYQRDDLRVMATRQNLDTIEAHQKPDGSRMFVHVIKTPLYNAEGEVIGVQGIFWDVTRRKEIEEELAYERDLLRSLLDTIPDRIYFKDINSRFLRCSKAMARRLGVNDPREVVGKTDFDFHPAELAQEFFADEQRIILTGQPLINKLERQTEPDGAETWASVTKVPFYNRHGQICGIIGISRDVTQLKRTEEALERARDAALESARIKSQFLANMSHEVRTPMHAIQGMTELLRDTALSAEQLEFVERIEENVDHLLHLINDILDFSKIEAGKLQCEVTEFDLLDLLENALEVVAERAHRKGLELLWNSDPDLPERLRGDPGRLRQVLINLLSNAVKFTAEGEVELAVKPVETTDATVVLRFSVRDTGMGIAPDQVERMFEPFTQADGSTTRRFGGTGLGLSICKQLVELMGGRIGCDTMPGRGSTFWFELGFGLGPRGTTRQDEVSPHAALPEDFKVLLLDRSPKQVRRLKEQLARLRVAATIAATPEAAWDLLQKAVEAGRPFSLACLDPTLADTEGRNLVERVAADPALAQTAIALLVPLGARRNPKLLALPNVLGCLIKPVRLSRLERCLRLAAQPGGTPAGAKDFVSGLAPCDTQVLPPETRVLVAEDTEVSRELVLRQLAKLGYAADVAANGREVLEALEKEPYDVVLLDCQMPELDGYEVARRIRRAAKSSTAQFKSVPYIIALTANAMHGDREKCLAAGMDDYLAKPVRLEMLQQALARAALCMEANAVSPTSNASAGGIAAADRASDPPAKRPMDDTPPEQPTLDLSLLDTLRQLRSGASGDPLQELVELYLRDARRRLEQLAAGLDSAQAEAVRQAAHSLKGSSSNLGARRLATLCAELEKAARQEDLAGAASILLELRREFQKVEASLEQQLRT